MFGASAGDLTSVPVRSLFALKTITGFSLLAWRAADPERARGDIAELTRLFEAGRRPETAVSLTDTVAGAASATANPASQERKGGRVS